MKELIEQLAKLSPAQRKVFEQKLAAKGIDISALQTTDQSIPKRQSDSDLPLSFAQQRLWFVQQLDPSNSAYNMMGVLILKGQLQLELITRAINTIIARHEPLRTWFELNEQQQPTQRIMAEHHISIDTVDVSHISDTSAREQAALEHVKRITQSPYDLSQPQFRAQLIKQGENQHLLALGTHHITSDRWSFTVFVRELGIIYHALAKQQPIPLPEPKVHYADWAQWQRQQLEGEKLEQQLGYWQETLSGELPVINLPSDYPRQALASYRGAQYPLNFDAKLCQDLRQLAASQGVTLYTLMLSAFKILLHRYTQLDDIIVGSEVANRDHSDTENMFGPLVNTVVIRSDLSQNPSFLALLKQVNSHVRKGLNNQDVPFEKIVEAINPERHLSQMSPLFQVKFDVQHASLKPFELEGMRIERYPLKDPNTKYELRFNIFDKSGDDSLDPTQANIAGQIEYACDVYHEDTMARLFSHYHNLLQAITAKPEAPLSDLMILSPEQLQGQLIHNNPPLLQAKTQLEQLGELNLSQRIEACAAATPEAIACISYEGQNDLQKAQAQKLSYQALNAGANQIAAFLLDQGLQAEQHVGVCLPASSQALMSILAIIKAGGSYVPMDVNYPDERLNLIAKTAKLDFVFCQEAQASAFSSVKNVYCNDQTIDQSQTPAPWAHYDTANLLNSAQAPLTQRLYTVFTSGSSGTPKGASVSQSNALHLLNWYRSEFDIKASDRCLVISALGFDLTQKNLWAPLLSGASVVFASESYDPKAIVKAIDEQQISLLNAAPSAIYPLVDLAAQAANPYQALKHLRLLLLGGEAPNLKRLKPWLSANPSTELVNMYGPTECTDIASFYRLPQAFWQSPKPLASSLPIGRAVPYARLYVLDSQYQQPVPPGVAGELYIGGAGLGLGYFDNPEQTEQAFIQWQAPITALSSQRLYKTGDSVRMRTDGQLEFIERLDKQIKLRGFRIEIGDIESALLALDSVCEAAVIMHQDDESENTDNAALLAYVVGHQDASQKQLQKLNTQALRSQLQALLPDYMVPQSLIELEALPLSANGKLDRKALPIPTRLAVSQTQLVAPETATQAALLAIWLKHLKPKGLGADEVGINHHFFELGGHSLLAIQIIADCEAEFGFAPKLQDFFRYPTISAFSEQIDLKRTAQTEQAESGLSEAFRIVAAPDQADEPFALTDIQQAYWLGRSSAFELGNIGTHAYREFDISPLDIDVLEQALNQLIQRHGMLRAVIDNDGRQRILPEVPHYAIALNDATCPSQGEAVLDGIRQRLSHQVFEPATWPLFHIEAAKLADTPDSDVRSSTDQQGRNETKYRIYLSFDVLIGDAWSIQLLGKELALLCQPELLAAISPSGKAELPALNLSFRDYVCAEEAYQQSSAFERDWQYWLNALETLPQAPELPLSKALSQVTQPSFSRRSATLAKADWDILQAKAQAHGLTPSGLMLSLYAVVLSHWSRQSAFSLNLTIFNRHPVHEDVNRIVGDFTASMLLGIDLQGEQAFLSRAQAIQEQLWQNFDHRAVSGVRVLRELAKRQNRAGSALMPVVFTSTLGQDNALAEQALREQSAWQTELAYSVSQTSQVYLDHQVGEINGDLIYNWDAIDELFPSGMLDAMFETYQSLLQRLLHQDSAWTAPLELISTAHFDALNKPAHLAKTQHQNRKHHLLHEAFFDCASRTPDRIAIYSDERSLSYGELADSVKALAYELEQSVPSLQANQLVAVSLNKSWRQVAACLAVLCTGAAYVPIDPSLPQQRRLELLVDTQAPLVITEQSSAWESADASDANAALIIDFDTCLSHALARDKASYQDLSLRQQASDLAYVIFTSGSTGKPKGVMIDHQGALNTIDDINRRFALMPDDRVFALSSLSFDLSVYDLFGPLALGAAIVMPSNEQVANTSLWRGLMDRYQISVWNSVPALAALLATEYATTSTTDSTSLRLIMMSGDWIPLSLPNDLERAFPQAQVYSLGGATEASIWSIFYPVKDVLSHWRSIPYGRPLTGQSWYVLDHNLKPCPPWVPGQLYIGGIGVAKGYWQRPELTAERFIPDPFNTDSANTNSQSTSTNLGAYEPGYYLYNTGDLGRLCLPSNHEAPYLEFLGRDDFQVKINGFRVELGEIEAALLQHEQVAKTVVHTCHQPPELVAYIVSQSPLDDSSEEETLRQSLHQHLSARLPAYMVPKHLMLIEAIPLSSNGKVDRKALPEPGKDTSRVIVAPKTVLEGEIIAIWQQLLSEQADAQAISMNDNFFEVGGNSLKAMQMLTMMQQQYQITLNIADIFQALTPQKQADFLSRVIAEGTHTSSSQGQIEAISREVETTDDNLASLDELETFEDLEGLDELEGIDALEGIEDLEQLDDDDVDAMLAQLMDD